MSSLDDLKLQRREIAAKLAATMEAQTRVREAANGESAALAAIGALGEKEVEAVQAWAVAGAEGPMPEFDAAERRRLAEALAAAQMRALAAQGALAGFDVAQRDLAYELEKLNAQIDALALDQLEERHRAEVKTIGDLIKQHVADRVARACALHSFLSERAQKDQAVGRIDAAREMYARAERIATATPPFDLTPLAGDVIAKVSIWSKRLDALVGDAPPVKTDLYAEPRSNNLVLLGIQSSTGEAA